VNLSGKVKEDSKDEILSEVSALSSQKGIKRFISTHPDEDYLLRTASR
jgi:hypothetical protein